jgi:hypothetical protein
MAARSATRTYPTLRAFLEDWHGMLRLGALTLPPGSIDGQSSAEMRVDLVIPLAGRVGPIPVQRIQVLPDGTAAMRVPEWPPNVTAAIEGVLATVEDVRDWLVTTGQTATPSSSGPGAAAVAEIASLRARVKDLESRPARVVHVAAPSGAGGGDGGPRIMVDEDGNRVVERGLIIPDVLAEEAALSGPLGDRSLRDALMELSLQRSTGLLTLQLPDGRMRWGLWQKGGPVGWRAEPTVEDEVLGILLFRAGQITREQLERSLAIMEESGVRQGEALIELGVFQFAQLVMLLQKQCEFVFQRVIRESSGTWSFHLLSELPERYITPPLRVASLLFRALRTHVRDMPAEELAGTLRPWLDQYVFFAEGAERMLEEVKTNAEETGFFKILGATSYRVREIFSVSNLARSATAGMIWTLAELNLIEFRETEADSRGNERLSRVLDDRIGAVVKGTLFEALDLHWICNAEEVEGAWRRLGTEFSPENTARWGVENRDRLVRIHEGMQRSYERLKVDARRREYRAEIMEKIMIEHSAELLAKKGEMAFMKENGREARDCFTKAVELMPKVPEYQTGLARARQMR